MSAAEEPLEISRDVRLDGDRALRASVGMFGFSITVDQVWLTIPDRFGNPTAFNFSHPDWERITELVASIHDESL